MLRTVVVTIAVLLLVPAAASATVRVEVRSDGLFISDNNVTFDDFVKVGVVTKSNGDLEYVVGKSRICGFTCVEIFLFDVGPGCRGGPNTETILCNRNVAKVRFDGRGGDDTLRGGGDVFGVSTGTFPDPMTFNGAAGDDSVDGGAAGDTLNLGSGDDFAFGFAGADTIEGSDGADIIALGTGADVVDAGAGDDTIRSETGAADADDTVDGGSGFDTFGYDTGNAANTRSARVDLLDRAVGARAGSGDDETDRIDNVERFRGGSGGDKFNAVLLELPSLSSLPHTYLGLGGNDLVVGTRGDNTIIGGAGADDMHGLDGNDVLNGKIDETTAVKDTTVDCGAGTADVAIIDLKDAGTQGCESVERSPIGEGPHVKIRKPKVRGRKVRFKLACPAALPEPCKGTLRLRPGGRKRYSVAAGKRKTVAVRMKRPLARRRVARVISREQGQIGLKTTIRRVVLRP